MYSQALDLPNYNLIADDERSDATKNKRTEEVEHKDNKIYSRFVLHNRDNISNQAEDDLSVSTAPKFVA